MVAAASLGRRTRARVRGDRTDPRGDNDKGEQEKKFADNVNLLSETDIYEACKFQRMGRSL